MSDLLKKHFPLCLGAAIFLGLLASSWLMPFEAAIDYCVAAIIFVGFFSRPQTTDSPLPSLSFLGKFTLQKMFFPLALYYVCREVFPTIALGLALVAALPAAAISPAISRLTGGDVTFSLKLLTYESLLACLSIPSIFAIATAGSFVVNPFEIAQYVVSVLLVPMVLAEISRYLSSARRAAQTKGVADLMAIGLIIILVTLIAAVVKPVLVQDPWYSLGLLALSVVLAPFFAVVGTLVGRPDTGPKAISLGVKTMYVNTGLGLGLAASHFDEHATLLILTYMIPINLMPRLAANLAIRVFALKSN